MHQDPSALEALFNRFWDNLKSFLPDGIVNVNLELLQELNLLQVPEEESSDALSHNFYIIESLEKLTLFNDKFAIWIVPHMQDDTPATLTLISKKKNSDTPQLEMAFATSGVYNHSSLVLKILERFLKEIDDNDKEINCYES
jgi:hypothetical protein